MPLNDSVMRGLKRSARRKQAFFEHPKATQRRARTPKAFAKPNRGSGELSHGVLLDCDASSHRFHDLQESVFTRR
jgi:hypothetical protein